MGDQYGFLFVKDAKNGGDHCKKTPVIFVIEIENIFKYLLPRVRGPLRWYIFKYLNKNLKPILKIYANVFSWNLEICFYSSLVW